MKYIKDNKTGSYYSYENGELIQWPMNLDGSRDKTPCVVDWYEARIEPIELDIYKHLKNIEFKLKGDR